MQNNNEAMPEPRKSKRDELVDALELNYISMALHHSNRAIAERIADRVIQAGWQWHPAHTNNVTKAYPEPTPEQEIDIIDRIISGLPANAVVVRPHDWHEGIADVIFPTGVKLYDVASKHPKEFFSDWYRVPAYDNYEVNSAGEVRNRWTRRVLEVAEQGGEEYVEMHDKEGFVHDINVRYIKEQVFGN